MSLIISRIFLSLFAKLWVVTFYSNVWSYRTLINLDIDLTFAENRLLNLLSEVLWSFRSANLSYACALNFYQIIYLNLRCSRFLILLRSCLLPNLTNHYLTWAGCWEDIFSLVYKHLLLIIHYYLCFYACLWLRK